MQLTQQRNNYHTTHCTHVPGRPCFSDDDCDDNASDMKRDHGQPTFTLPVTRSFSHYHPSAISFFWIHRILHDILRFVTIITRYWRYFMTHDRCKICPKKSAKCVICMSNTQNGTHSMHQMHKSGKKYANRC